MDPITVQLGQRIDDFSLADVPTPAREKANYLLLDSIGVMIGGTQIADGRKMAALWDTMGGAPDASSPAIDRKLPTASAAYLNGYLANLLDYDDTYSKGAIGHPGATIVPPALAVAEATDADGSSLLAAILAGYEVSIRVGDSIRPSRQRSQLVEGTGTWQTFGAVTATARLLELSPTKTAHALAHAGLSAPVPLLRKVGIVDDFMQSLKNNYGLACFSGVMAGLLAERGFEGNLALFESERGFWRMAGSDQFDAAPLERAFDGRPAVMDVSYKPYSAGRWSHVVLDCISELKPSLNEASLSTVESIEVESFHEAVSLDVLPDRTTDGPFSIPYVVAVHLLDYPTGYGWFSEDLLSDERVRTLARRVTLKREESMDEAFDTDREMRARVTITLDDGTQYEAAATDPSGTPQNPMTPAQIEAKFDALVSPLVGDQQATELRETILSIEGESSVAPVSDIIAGSAGRSN